MEGERSAEVLQMAASTRVLPMTDTSISGAFNAQLMTLRVSGFELTLIFSERKVCDSFCPLRTPCRDMMLLSP